MRYMGIVRYCSVGQFLQNDGGEVLGVKLAFQSCRMYGGFYHAVERFLGSDIQCQ